MKKSIEAVLSQQSNLDQMPEDTVVEISEGAIDYIIACSYDDHENSKKIEEQLGVSPTRRGIVSF